MSKVFKRGPTTPEMNMTPLIDVTFQLIIFFMLVNNIVAEQIVEMIPPTLKDPQTRELQEENQLVVNVAPQPFRYSDRIGNEDAHLVAPGVSEGVQIRSQKFDLGDVQGIAAAIREEVEANPAIKVILRADSALYYEEVQHVMAAISEAQVKEVHLVAYMPDKGARDTAAAADQGGAP